MTHTFTLLGTGAGCGVPAFFCGCPACNEAREHPEFARGCCGVLVEGVESGRRLLIDTPPDIRHYFNRHGVRSFDELLFTHWHSDHVTGLMEMEYMTQLYTHANIPVHASAITIAQLKREFGFMDYCLDFHELGDGGTFEFDGVRYTALPVRHAPGTFGFLVETLQTRLFYASDTGPLPAETAERVRGVDALVLDATYWKSCPTDQHHCVQQTIEEGFALDAGCIYLTHLCMHYTEPITYMQLSEYLRQYDGRVVCGMDGMAIGL